MSDPTFAQQFGRAVQSDVLRQAAQDRQRRRAWCERDDAEPAWLVAAARRLAMALRTSIPHRGCRGPVRAEVTDLHCCCTTLAED